MLYILRVAKSIVRNNQCTKNKTKNIRRFGINHNAYTARKSHLFQSRHTHKAIMTKLQILGQHKRFNITYPSVNPGSFYPTELPTPRQHPEAMYEYESRLSHQSDSDAKVIFELIFAEICKVHLHSYTHQQDINKRTHMITENGWRPQYGLSKRHYVAVWRSRIRKWWNVAMDNVSAGLSRRTN